MNGAGGGLTLGVFKDNLGQIFSCVLAGLHWREGEKLSHVVRCCLQLRAGFSSHARLRAQRSDDSRKDGDDNLDDAFQCKSFHFLATTFLF